MNIRDLQELKKEEDTKTECETLKIINRILDGKITSFSKLDLYPEFRKEFKNKVYTNQLPYKPVTIQLPFYDTVILQICPWNTPEYYEKMYGISLEQTIELIDRNRAVPLLVKDYTKYANLSNNYMDKLLERSPPTLNRMRYLDCIATAENKLLSFEDVSDISELEQKRKEVYAKLQKYVSDKYPEQAATAVAYWHSATATATGHFPGEAIGQFEGDISSPEYYAMLSNFGYSDLAERLIALPRIAAMFGLYGYSEILLNAPYLALDGATSIDDFYLRAAKFPQSGFDITDNDVVQAFNVDIGQLLIERFNLINTSNIGYDRIIKLNNTTKEARRALFELDHAVAAAKPPDLLDKTQTAVEVFKNVNEEYEEMIKKKKLIREYFPLSLGVIGGITDYFLGKPLILSIVFSLAGGKIMKVPAVYEKIDSLLKYKKPQHICAFYDLATAVSKEQCS